MRDKCFEHYRSKLWKPHSMELLYSFLISYSIHCSGLFMPYNEVYVYTISKFVNRTKTILNLEFNLTFYGESSSMTYSSLCLR